MMWINLVIVYYTHFMSLFMEFEFSVFIYKRDSNLSTQDIKNVIFKLINFTIILRYLL